MALSKKFTMRDNYSSADLENFREFVDEYDAMSLNLKLSAAAEIEFR